VRRSVASVSYLLHRLHEEKTGAAFSKVPRKILGKLLILGATGTQVATSSRGYSATVEHRTNTPINSVQRSNRKLCSSSSSNSSSNIRSYLKIFLGTFKTVAPSTQNFGHNLPKYRPSFKILSVSDLEGNSPCTVPVI